MSNLERKFYLPFDVVFAIAIASTLWGIGTSIVTHKYVSNMHVFPSLTITLLLRNLKRFPLEPGLGGFLFQMGTVMSLLVPKLLLVSSAIINAPFCYMAGVMAELLLISLYNWAIFGSMDGKSTVGLKY